MSECQHDSVYKVCGFGMERWQCSSCDARFKLAPSLGETMRRASTKATIIADLEQQLADVGSINLSLMEQLADLRGFINDLLSEEKNKWSAGKLLVHLDRIELWRDETALKEQDNE